MLMIREIQAATARHYGVPLRNMMERGYPTKLKQVSPRQVAMFLSRELTGKSYALIAERFWRKDHTTARYSYHRVKQSIETDTALAANVEAIRQELAA